MPCFSQEGLRTYKTPSGKKAAPKLGTTAHNVILLGLAEDDALIQQAIHFLTDQGSAATFDSAGGEISVAASAKGSELLRKTYAPFSKAILLATPGVIDSRWSRWTLGFAESVFGSSNCAVIGVGDEYDALVRSDALRAPAVIRRDGVHSPGQRDVLSIRDWLNR